MELVGGDVEVHQPATGVLRVDQPSGQLLDVRFGGRQPPLEVDHFLLARAVAFAARDLEVVFEQPRQLTGALEVRAQLGSEPLRFPRSRSRRVRPRTIAGGIAHAARPWGSCAITAMIS